MKGRIFMKHLKIENSKGYFLRNKTSWISILEMCGDDIKSLAKQAIYDNEFDMDALSTDLLPNPAQNIIYQRVYDQLMSLYNRRDAFKEECRNIYQEAYDKYCQE